MSKGNAPSQLGSVAVLIPGSLLLAAAVLFGFGWFSNQHTLSVLALWSMLMAAILWRSQADRERSPNPEKPAKKAGDVDALFGSFVAAWTLGSLSFSLGYQSPSAVAQLPIEAAFLATTALLGVAVLALAYLQKFTPARAKELPSRRSSFAPWVRMSIWLITLSGLTQLLVYLSVIPNDAQSVELLMLVAAMPAMEWVVRALIKRRELPNMLSDGNFVPLFFSSLNPFRSVVEQLEARFEINIQDTWSFNVLRRSIQPTAVTLLLVGWLSKSVVAIGAFETGVHERFGRPVSEETLKPGLHLKAPWPIDTVHRYPSTRIETLTLGYSGQRDGASLLWTKQHADQEYTLLLGDGRDLVTVNANLEYYIADVVKWHYSTQNPLNALEALAEQALLRNTVARSLDGVLSENLSEFSHAIETQIAAGADELDLGVTIVGVSIQGLHPPVSIATNYQAVVSAQHEQETSIHAARAYEVTTLAQAEADALSLLTAARSESMARLAKANGEASAFNALRRSYVLSPALYRFRRRAEMFETNLEGRSLNIIDDRIERDGGAVWFQQ